MAWQGFRDTLFIAASHHDSASFTVGIHSTWLVKKSYLSAVEFPGNLKAKERRRGYSADVQGYAKYRGT